MASINRHAIPVCIVNDTRIDRHHGCARVMTAIEALLAKNGFQVVGTNPAHTNWESNPVFMRALGTAQLLLVNGEGTIHHDRPAGRQLLRISGYAKTRGIPAALINTGWESNGAEFLEHLKCFTLVAARDRKSAAQMRQGGATCTIVPDLSLYGTSNLSPSLRAGGVLFSDSVDRFKAVELERYRRTVNGKTLSIVYPLAGTRGYLKFIREGFAIRDALTPRLLVDIMQMRHRLWQNSHNDILRYIAALSQAELLVSGRFHACTLALTTGTPFVTIASNTDKIASLIADAGLECWRVDAELTPDAINEYRRKGWSGSEQNAIRNYLESANERAEDLFRELVKLV
jgi:hypothetical protein